MNKLNKKAIELSLQAVVVGIILLVVLGVVLYIFGSNIGEQNKFLKNQSDTINDKESRDSFVKDLIKPEDGYLLPVLLLPLKKRKNKLYEKTKTIV